MKKTIATAFMVFSLALLSFIAIYSYINQQQNQVTIDETVLFGDVKAAEGLTFTTSACDSRSRKLFWKTEHVISEQPKTVTQFQRIDEGKYDVLAHDNFVELAEDCFVSRINIRSDVNTYVLAEDHPVISDVASRAANGKTHEEIHKLREYYQYYPVKLSMNISGISIDEASLHADYFKIPVPADYSIKVSVKKDETGNVVDYDMEPVHSYLGLDSDCLFTATGCFAALPDLTYEPDHESSEEDDDGNFDSKELKLPDDMRGIHFIPFVLKKKSEKRLSADFDNGKLILPLPSTSQLLRMQQSQDQKKLFILIRDNGELVLSVIDAASKKVLQRTPLQQISGQRNMNMIKEKDGNLLIVTDDGKFHLFTQKGNQYSMEFSGSFNQVADRQEFSSLPSYWSFDYDGKNLALAAFARTLDDRNADCSAYVFFYRQSKLKYAGYYKNSLNKENAGSESDFAIAPAISYRAKNSANYSTVDGITVKLN